MFEHFQSDKQERYAVEDKDLESLMEIAAELVADEDALTEEGYTMTPGMVNGLAMMMFRAGRSFQADEGDAKTVTIHIPVERAGRFIEMLIAEES